MPVKVFTSPGLAIASIVGGSGADMAAAGASITAFNGNTGTFTITTNTDNFAFGSTNPTLSVGINVSGALIDDATIPAAITVTNIRIAYDWTLETGAGVPGPGAVAFVVADGNDPGGELLAAGSASGHSEGDNDPAVYLGGTTRAALFAGAFAWSYLGYWGNYTAGAPVPFVAHTRRVAVSNFTVTVTYASPVVTSVTPNSGSVNGGHAVTIRGSGFLAATGVTFGGVAVTSFVIVDDETMTAVTPEHLSGAVDVAVLSVATGLGLYTYVLDRLMLPPMPDRTPIAQGKGNGG